jgi:hypothetical protein
VDGLDQIGLEQVQLVEAARERGAVGVQLGAHPAVEQDGRAFGQAVEKRTPQVEREVYVFATVSARGLR